MKTRLPLSLLILFVSLSFVPKCLGQTVTIATWNVAGSEPSDLHRPRRLAAAIRSLNPDLIVLTHLSPDSLATEIKDELTDYDLEILPQQSTQNIAILHKHTHSVLTVRLINGSNATKSHLAKAITARVRIGNLSFLLIGVQMMEGRSFEARSVRSRQALAVARFIQPQPLWSQTRLNKRNVLVIGDYNMILGERTFDDLSPGVKPNELLQYISNRFSSKGISYVSSCINGEPSGKVPDGFGISKNFRFQYVNGSLSIINFNDSKVFLSEAGLPFDCATFKKLVSDHLPLVATFRNEVKPNERVSPASPDVQVADGERDEGRGIFSHPIWISPANAVLLKKEAESLRANQIALDAKLASIEHDETLSQRKNALLVAISDAKEALIGTRNELVGRFAHRSLDTAPFRKAVNLVFFEIEEEYKVLLKNVEEASSANYASVRKQTFALLNYNTNAYTVIAENGSLTFNLVVNSTPQQGSTISFKRKGDPDYTPNGNETNTTIENLVFAEWYVRVELKGYLPKEKLHNAWREKNHFLLFELEPEPPPPNEAQDAIKPAASKPATPVRHKRRGR